MHVWGGAANSVIVSANAARVLLRRRKECLKLGCHQIGITLDASLIDEQLYFLRKLGHSKASGSNSSRRIIGRN